jgi:hypothetical protein
MSRGMLLVAVLAVLGCSQGHPEEGMPMPALPQYQPGEPARPKLPPQAPLPKYEERVPAGMQAPAAVPVAVATVDAGAVKGK